MNTDDTTQILENAKEQFDAEIARLVASTSVPLTSGFPKPPLKYKHYHVYGRLRNAIFAEPIFNKDGDVDGFHPLTPEEQDQVQLRATIYVNTDPNVVYTEDESMVLKTGTLSRVIESPAFDRRDREALSKHIKETAAQVFEACKLHLAANL